MGHATERRSHDIAELREQDLTTTDGQPITHSLHVLLVGQEFCIWSCYIRYCQQANAGSATAAVPADPLTT